jgi:sialate O-acetylesterase
MKTPRPAPRRLATGLSALLLAAALAPSLSAAVVLHPLFGDHAVIQSGDNVPVWGTADDGEKVTVRLGGQEASAVTTQGRWEVRFNGLKASPTAIELVATGKANTAKSTDVLVGEVWLCSGQSNMDYGVGGLLPADRDEAVARSLPTLRFFNVAKVVSATPLTTTQGKWQIASGKDVLACTAVGYFFGRSLQQTQPFPVGLIGSKWGGTLAEAWTRDEALKAQPSLASLFTRDQQGVAAYPQQKAAYVEAKAAYDQAVVAAKAAGQPLPKAPPEPVDPATNKNRPSRLYNGMIHPLLPVAIRGILWYQGEGNKLRPLQYQTMLPAMIADWRQQWGRGDLPFYIVQIAPFSGMTPEIREAQMKISERVPNAGIVCTLDVGEVNDIHPKNKRPVGERLALLARRQVYGETTVVASGPRFAGLSVAGAVATVKLSHTDGGLVATGGTLKGFAVAGADEKFFEATAVIKGDTVEVTAAGVTAPVAVRYGWAGFPVTTLANGAGLPAFPFRSDEWKTEVTN